MPYSRPTPPPRPTPRHATLPSLKPAKVDEQALAKARSQAEKYKPKTPSGLRTASRYSSPLTVASPESVLNDENLAQEFGNDQFAQDAQWLYANCPSGNLEELTWPAPELLASNLGIQLSVALLEPSERQMDEIYDNFRHGVEEFEKTLV